MQYRIYSIVSDKIIATFDNEVQLIGFINEHGFKKHCCIEMFKPSQYSWVVPAEKGYIERS